jgi:hypothetical protein
MTSRAARKLKNLFKFGLTLLGIISVLELKDWLSLPWQSYVVLFSLIVTLIAGYSFFLWLMQILVDRELKTLFDRGFHLAAGHQVALFLRSFEASQSTLESHVGWELSQLTGQTSHERFRYDAEEDISDAIANRITLVAIGDKCASFGSAKLVVNDADWQLRFEEIAKCAVFIVMIVGPSHSLLVEMDYIIRSPQLLSKTLFVMPRKGSPGSLRPQESTKPEGGQFWDQFLNEINGRYQIQFPRYIERGCYFRILGSPTRIEAVDLITMTRYLGWYMGWKYFWRTKVDCRAILDSAWNAAHNNFPIELGRSETSGPF